MSQTLSKQNRPISLPSLKSKPITYSQRNKIAEIPAKYLLPKHLQNVSMQKSIKNQLILKSIKIVQKKQQFEMMTPLKQLDQLNDQFQKIFNPENFIRKKRQYTQPTNSIIKKVDLIQKAKQRLQKSRLLYTSRKVQTNQKKQQLVKQFDQKFYLRQWGQLKYIIYKQNQEDYQKNYLQKGTNPSRCTTDPSD